MVAVYLSDTCDFDCLMRKYADVLLSSCLLLLLRCLWSGFCVPNCTLLAVFGSLYLTDTLRPSVLQVKR